MVKTVKKSNKTDDQPNQPEENPNKNIRITKIRKHLERTIQTAKFENVKIYVEAEDSIEWNTLEERQRKLDDVTSLLIQDFQQTQLKVFQELKLEPNSATVGGYKPIEKDEEKTTENESKKSINNSSQGGLDLFDEL